jgi:hypothetical protein
MCKYIWFKEQKRQQRYERPGEIDQYYEPEFGSNDIKLSLLDKHMIKLSAICQDVLTLYSLNYSEEEISRILNLKGSKEANNWKYNCKARLHKMIVNDPLYVEEYG